MKNTVMKSKTVCIILFFAVIFFTACEKIDTGKSFDSVVNDRLRVSTNLAFSIDSIRDYRCPGDVICIWAGDVDIHIRFFKTFGHVDTVMNLNNTRRNPISIGGYTFKINEVNPYPVSYKVTPQEEYRINMTITVD